MVDYGTMLDTLGQIAPRSNAHRIVRAPGRVNVIGEHTDYNGLPVMPMAIDREITIAYSPYDTSSIRLINTDPVFPEREFTSSEEIEHYPSGDWGNYAKAAAQALWNWAKEHSPSSLPLRGFTGCVSGTIPAGSGLSSSSAMVVAVACVLVEVNSLHISKQQLAELLARGEHYVGTEGGGMDQAASLLSEPDSLLKIDFRPLRTLPVRLPDDCVFVIANSMKQANKAGGAKTAFNTRVVECRLALQMLKALARDKYPQIEDAVLLGDVLTLVPEGKNLIDLLPEQPVSLEQIAGICGVSAESIADQCLRLRNGLLLEAPAGGFSVKKRCRHAFTEGERVSLAVSAVKEGNLAELGKLMDQSHASCASDYEISCDELDELVAALRQNGALGARLTGAGFGGCTVAVVQRDNADKLIEGVWRDYYQTSLADKGIIVSEEDKDSALFACTASAGAGRIRD